MDIEDMIAVVLAGILLMVAHPEARACDCTFHAIDALYNAGVRVRTIPPVVVNKDFPRGYKDGVITIHRTDDCKVMTHELAHHVQHETYGPAQSWADWERRERDADTLTAYAYKGGCL